MKKSLLALALVAMSQSALAEKAKETRSTNEVIASASADDWRSIPQERLLYLNLADKRQVIFELAPEFAPKSVEQIQFLAKNKFWDDLEIYRMQDNYVVQFGDAAAVHNPEKAKKLPEGHQQPPAEFERDLEGLKVSWLEDKDPWSEGVGFVDGFAVAKGEGKAWLAHCYGALGVGRDMAPDSGTGAELYVVIGQSPRYLDRNITLAGRVVYGMEHLSALKRGGGSDGGYAGFYQDPSEYTKIESIRVGNEVPEAEQLKLETMKTDSEVFKAMVETRRNRTGDWFVRQVGYTDVCNIAVPVRVAQ
ncbi:MAG: peptidylprolyl isomerase [Cardiobacteriaceae bacterium]|nr:peptidylprolyl isomerase [Cardiobacteriaceae bacterium]